MDLLQTFIKVGVKDEATDGVASIGAGVLAKAQLIADGIKSMASAAFNTIKDVVGGAVDAYSTYQQQTGGIETFFNQMSASGEKASDVVIANAKKAYQTAGMSANQYMENVGSFATTLIQSVAKEREQAAKGDVEAQAAALDQQLADAKSSYAAQYEAQKRNNDKAAQSYSDQLSDELSALKKRLNSEVSQRKEQLDTELSQLKESLNAQVEERKQANEEALSAKRESLAEELSQLKESLNSQVEQQKEANQKALDDRRESLAEELSQLKDSLNSQLEQRKSANQKALDERKKELDREYDELQRSLEKQVSEVQKSQEAEVREYQKATDLRIKEINREYTEKLKLIDEEQYARVKAIEDQIDALDAQTEAERAAIEKRNQMQKVANLEARVAQAESNEDRIKAQQELTAYLEEIAQKDREAQRKLQKQALQEQKQAVKDEYSARKETIREAQSEELSQYKEARSDQLSALKSSQKDELDAIKDGNKSTLQQAKDTNSAIISQMQEQQKAEIAQIQASNAAQISEKEKSNAAILKEMQSQQAAEIKAMQTANAAQVTEREKANAEILKEMQKQQSAEITAMQKANAEQIAEREKANGQIISQMQDQNEAQIQAQQRNNRDLLDDFRTAQADQLAEMKESQGKQLEQLENFIAEQKAALQDGSFVEATYDDQIRAAQLADMAITDMSDNANKMGTDIGLIQNAYQGFAKDNFTMLDNLKLGYSGSKEGMEQLLADAEKIQEKNGNIVDYTIDSFADIVEAIHVVQREYGVSGYSADELSQKLKDQSLTTQDLSRVAQYLGKDISEVEQAMKDGTLTFTDASVLLGTTAREGSDTVEGSFNQMKAAWENFLTALADPNGNVDESLDTLMGTVETYLDNLVPVLTNILDRLIPIVIEKGGEIARQLWDAIYNAIPEDKKEKFGEIIDAIKGIGDAVVELYDKKELILLFFGAFEATQFVVSAAGAFDKLKTVADLAAKALGIGGVATAAGDAAAAAGGLGEVIEVGGTAFTVFEGGAASSTGAMGGLLSSISPFLGPAGVIIAAGAAILYLVGTNEELMKTIEGVVTDTDHLSSDTEIQTANMGTSWEKLEQSMATSAKDASDAVQVQTASMTSNWSTSMSQMDTDTDNTTNALVSKLQTFASNSGVPLDEVSNKIKEMAKSGGDSFDTLNSKAGTVVGAMTNMESGSSPKIKGMGNAFEGMKKTAETALEGAKTKAKDALTEIAKTADTQGSTTATKWKGNMESFRKATEVEINTTTQRFSGLGKSLATAAGGFSLDTQGTNIMRSFYNGMVREWNSNVTSFVQNIASWIKEHKGPEQYDKQLLVPNGQWIMQGLERGITDGFGSVKDTVGGIGGDIDKETTNSVSGIQDSVTAAMERAHVATTQGMRALYDSTREGGVMMVDSMSAVMTELTETVKKSFADIENSGSDIVDLVQIMIEKITIAFKSNNHTLISAGEQLMNGFLQGLANGFKRVQQFVGDIGPWIQQNKGPEEYDKKLLIPNGGWIMDGLQKGLEGTFEHDVMPYVSNMGEMMRGAFGVPILSPMASVLNRSNSVPQLAAQQGRDLTVILELDRVQFGRLVYQMNNDETQRVGVRLAGGAA